MGTTVQGIGNGGLRFSDLGNNICGGGPGGPNVWVGDMGEKTTQWGGVGSIPPQGGP